MPRAKSPGRDQSGYLTEETIAAIATPTGGAVAMIRISGKDAFSALNALTKRDLADFPPRELRRAALVQPGSGEPLDDAMAVRFVAPHSYTGEDSVELHIHGSPYVAQSVLEALTTAGVRQALPGEFSFRAVRNGKMSITQAQAVADLIGSSNENARQLALEKLSGTQNALISALAADLRQLSMLGEVGIDFSDQDVEEVSLPALKRRAGKAIDGLRRLEASYDRGSRIQDGVGVAFVGLPNAGKSSFFNALLGEDRSIVSEIAGTTRDVVRERLTLRGANHSVTLRLEDTAGLRHATDTIEKMGIERTEKAARHADALLFLVDATAGVEKALEQWARIGAPRAKALGVLTKCDLATPEQLSKVRVAIPAFGIPRWVETSAVTLSGIQEAVEAIVEHCARWVVRERGEVVLTRLDQLQAVQATLSHLERAVSAPEIDLFAADIRQGLHALAPLIGDTTADEILGQIFTSFCIGK